MVDKGVARKGDANAELGAGFATGFLNKMEGVLEGLVSDMADGWTEGQVSGFFSPVIQLNHQKSIDDGTTADRVLVFGYIIGKSSESLGDMEKVKYLFSLYSFRS